MPVSSVHDPDLSPPPSLHPSQHAFDTNIPDGSATHEPQGLALMHQKKHVCAVCNRAFSISAHLARHARIHTGERNHKCPFPGCETRCSRQDNLQQHYRIHLFSGSRRNSCSATPTAMNRAKTSSRPRSSRPRSSRPRSSRPRRSAHPGPTSDRERDAPMSPPLASPSPPLEPPPLAQAHPEPPDTPPPLAPAYPTLHAQTAPGYASASAPSLLARTTPDGAYHSHSPVAYGHAQLASAYGGASAGQYQTDENAYPPSSRASSVGHGYDGRWPGAYYRAAQGGQQGGQIQGDHSYPASEADRCSPVSGSPANGYADPISPVESLHRYGHGDVQMFPREGSSYFANGNPYPRQTTNGPGSGGNGNGNGNSAVPTSASPVSYAHAHAQSQSVTLLPSVSSHRHSIAHIFKPPIGSVGVGVGVGRQHSGCPSALSHGSTTNSASPVVSTPPTPARGYGRGYVAMGGYTESLPDASPITPSTQTHAGVLGTVYSSYESSELAGAGYSCPPFAHSTHQQQHGMQQQMGGGYDPSRTLSMPGPAPLIHAWDPQPPSQQLHFDYGQTQPQSQYAGEMDRYSPRPVLAPIQDVRTRGENGWYGSPQPPPMQSLASVSRHSHPHQQHSQQQHAFAYPSDGPQAASATSAASDSVPSTSTSTSTSAAAGGYTHPPSGYSSASSYGNDGYAPGFSSASGYYYPHPHQHPQYSLHPHRGHREPSPRPGRPGVWERELGAASAAAAARSSPRARVGTGVHADGRSCSASGVEGG